MDSFTKPARFTYNPGADAQPDHAFSGILEIYVHHARNIHNICIYDNQDVYAKFSLTCNPDETVSTRIINGGGKNPEFNQDLIMKINRMEAVLKCEIWMLSRAKNFMDDQLLGFALVPIFSLSGQGKVTQDYDLSSTDLLHSPAGTIKLSLSLNANTAINSLSSVSFGDLLADKFATSEHLMDKKIPEDYSRIEFPDINIVSENQQMVSEYFSKNGSFFRPWLEKPDGSFLHLGLQEDFEMAGNSSDECPFGSVSQDGSIQNPGFLSSTMTSLSDERNSADSTEKKGTVFADFSTSLNDNPSLRCSKNKDQSPEGNEPNFLEKEKESDMKVDSGESAMQKQIVEMYMRSMQQFTESLEKMKLPMDLDKLEKEGSAIQEAEKTNIAMETKKDNSRVFYGSRAFF